MVNSENYNPYCPICDGCGEEGCCSANICQQHPDGYYCKGYLRDLKFGYDMNNFVQNNILDKISNELKDEYDAKWNELFDRYYK